MKRLFSLFCPFWVPLASVLLLSSASCAPARLEPADDAHKVPNRPKAAAMETETGVRVQVEADAWVADERVRDEVTAMKVTLVNRGQGPVVVDYHGFVLRSPDGATYQPVEPKDIRIRGARRSIGLPADTIITRTSDSSINAPQRSVSEKSRIRERLEEQALPSGELPPGERRIGYIYFERVPSTKDEVRFTGRLSQGQSGKPVAEIDIPFRSRKFQ